MMGMIWKERRGCGCCLATKVSAMATGDTNKELDSLVAEYLESRGLKKTVSTFYSESKESRESTSSSDLQSEFVVAFECGERQVFFQLWAEHVPARLRDGDPTAQHLECSVSAYFAVYPLRTGTGNREEAMAAFRTYLENRGSQLSQNTELASLFALPYVPNPSNHPSFKKLFLESWTVELKARVIQFLELVFPNSSTNKPNLVKLYLKSQRDGGVMVQEDCVSKLAEMQNSYHTLVGISMELVSALESAIAGRPITPEYIQSICTRLFQSSTAQSSTAQSQPPPEPPKTPIPAAGSLLLRASVTSLRQSLQVSDSYLMSETGLDYDKIKTELVGAASCSSKALLLQALRWRLTRSLPGNQRDSVISQYVGEDLLGCSSPNSSHLAAIIQLLQTTDHNLREQLARLFNTLASLTGGRGYISQSPAIIQALLYLMYGEEGADTHTRRNCLGAIQKLSLRRSIVRMMIKSSVVQYLAECLLSQPHSEYTVRYSLALLLNVSLRCIGKTYCEPYSEILLTVLGEYLEHEDQEICSYVNGALYSLLASPSIRDVARQIGMEEMLQSALRGCPPDVQSQIEYILSQLGSEEEGEGSDSGDEGDSEEEEDEEVGGVREPVETSKKALISKALYDC
ncbi:lisH domain-containing protein ARMC9-like isoform X1 [Halichondria panicea]|uniref:lisH domain-containing protein ARMC9-like isoform X1 n=1 Tax=Halichondria panicea TaxID=6063 RepID=UPI00312B549B